MKISLVIPVFNEEDTIPIFYKAVREFDGLKAYDVEMVFINDGSRDSTEAIINALSVSDSNVQALNFPKMFAKTPLGCQLTWKSTARWNFNLIKKALQYFDVIGLNSITHV